MENIELAEQQPAATSKPGLLLEPLEPTAPGLGNRELPPSPSSQKPINTIGGSGESGEAGEPPLTKQEKKEVWKYRAKILGGLMLPFFLNSIDLTIVATALPYIAADFGMCILSLVVLNRWPCAQLIKGWFLTGFIQYRSAITSVMDRYYVHNYPHCIHSCIWSMVRCFWPSQCSPVYIGVNMGGLRTLCWGPNILDAVIRKSDHWN